MSYSQYTSTLGVCYPFCSPLVQGADNKLGQFLGQDIEASANHRNVLRPSLESYSSLVSHNVSKPSLVTKICRQSTKLLQLSKKLCAPRRNQQGIEKFLKVHRSLVYLLKTVLNQNQDIGEADVTPARKQHKIFSLRHGPVGSSQARATSCSPTSLRWDRGGQHQAVHRGP
jgi:hypothetical protein